MEEGPAEAEAVVGSSREKAQDRGQPCTSRLERTEMGPGVRKRREV